MEPRLYTIRVGAVLAPDWADWFDGMRIEPRTDGTTDLIGPVRDQAALFGLLLRARDLGLPLVSVVPNTSRDQDT